MLANIIDLPKSGRDNLPTINTATFLYGMQQLAAGKKLPVDEKRWQIAYATYLARDCQLGTAMPSKDLDGLLGHALGERRKHENKIAKSSMSPQREKTYRADNGMIVDGSILKTGANPQQKNEKLVSGTETAIGAIMDLMHFAAHAATDPVGAIISIAAANALYNTINNTAHAAADAASSVLDKMKHDMAEILFEKLENHAETPEAKELCVIGLNATLTDEDRFAYKERIENRQKAELARHPDQRDDRHLVGLEALKKSGRHEDLENRLAFQEKHREIAPQKALPPHAEMLAIGFEENRAMTSPPVPVLSPVSVAPVKNPFLIDNTLKPAPPNWAKGKLRDETAD